MPQRGFDGGGGYQQVTFEDGSQSAPFADLMRLIVSRPPLSPYPLATRNLFDLLAYGASQRAGAMAPINNLRGLFGGVAPSPGPVHDLPGLFGGMNPVIQPARVPIQYTVPSVPAPSPAPTPSVAPMGMRAFFARPATTLVAVAGPPVIAHRGR